MRLFERSTSRFAAGVAIPVLLILAGSIIFILLALKDMAAEVDRSDAIATEASVRAALNALEQRLVETHGDYAVWDDAATKLYGTVDQEFARTNYGESTRTGVLFDGAYLLDETGRTAFSYRRGAAAARGPIEEYGAPLQSLINTLDGHMAPYDAKVGLMKDRSGAIAIVAVGSIQPSSNSISPPAGRPRLLVLARTIDDVVMRRIGRSFVIEGLRLRYDTPAAGSSSAAKNRVELIDPDGTVLGAFAWTHPSRGDEAFSRIAPATYLTMLMIGTTILFLLAIGYRNLVDLRRREAQALYAARHDGLTGLANRSALTQALETMMRPGSKRRIAVVYLDLDGFKEVNDGYGHEAGDRVLKMVARGFHEIGAPLGMLGRVGGDEFALIIERPDHVADVEEIGNRLVRFFHTPLTIDGRIVPLGTSVGIAVSEAGAISAAELLRRADVAMYRAKEMGRNRVAVHDAAIEAARTDRRRLATDLRAAIAAGELGLVFQPIVDATSQRPALVEALVRWERADGVSVEPELFVSVAEENGLAEQLGEWVLRHACMAALAWPDLSLSVNISPLQFRHPRFDRLLAAILDETGLPPARLELEITEAHLAAMPDRIQGIIASLRLIGVRVVLDEFGSGSSSIGSLRRFAFDRLKLDRSLVHGIALDGATRRLCEATIMLGHALNLAITAAGIETEAEAALLRALGCSHLQGAAFGRPVPADALTRRLAAEPALGRWREGLRVV